MASAISRRRRLSNEVPRERRLLLQDDCCDDDAVAAALDECQETGAVGGAPLCVEDAAAPTRTPRPGVASSSTAAASSSTAPARRRGAAAYVREHVGDLEEGQRAGATVTTHDAKGDEVVIEMSIVSDECERRAVAAQAAQQAAACSAASPAVSSRSRLPEESPRGRGIGARTCFICLENERDYPVVSCCSTCYACTHVRCWRDWRNNQRITALRSRLLGLRTQQSSLLLRCTICKSGTAMVAGEEDGLSWMNELLCGGDASGGDEGGARAMRLAHVQRSDSDEDRDTQLEDLVDMRTCGALAVYMGLLVLVLVIACTFIVTRRFYSGDVVFSCIIALYELSVLQIVVLAVARRRGAAAVAAATAARAAEASAAARSSGSATSSTAASVQPSGGLAGVSPLVVGGGRALGARGVIAAVVAAQMRGSASGGARPLLLATEP